MNYVSDPSYEKTIDCVDLFEFFRGEVRSESNAINCRLQALLGSQSFLVIAYATALTGFHKDGAVDLTILVPCLFCLLGFLLALMALPGIRAGYACIEKWEKKQSELISRNELLGDMSLISTKIEAYDTRCRARRAAMFTHQAPLLFLIAWSIFFLIPSILFAGHLWSCTRVY
ncbi:hypothetical protein [Asaia astilbis]|uniref:hypothetical protein n=1 Tax=Asaia astilbis TaxID=610244 RepID=UPI00046EE72A|nr:hypothetical protein [Asaia astilbis]